MNTLRIDPAQLRLRPHYPRLATQPPPAQLTHAQLRLLMVLARGPRAWTDCDVFETRGLEAAGLIAHDRTTDLVTITPAGCRLLRDTP